MTRAIESSYQSRHRNSHSEPERNNSNLKHLDSSSNVRHSRQSRVHPESREISIFTAMGDESDNDTRLMTKPQLRVETCVKQGDSESQMTPVTVASTPTTSPNAARSRDLRSPREERTPVVQVAKLTHSQGVPDFITQTDANGNATTPRSSEAIQGARRYHPSGPKPRLHVDEKGRLSEDDDSENGKEEDDPCEFLFEHFRMMCCCLMDDHHVKLEGVATEDSDQPIKLLGPHHPDDSGKKCLVLDLDETLVHSSFRAVPNSDFVIPVQIENVTHMVYVAKRPGVDKFLVEMAKHYEIVIYTASLNKYADPLLDLLDPHKVIRARLFRESCVYYEGNYVKDLSLLNRDLSKTIIIDNSPASYMFHPENAIDCSSFIDDRNDRELDQIGEFLIGIKDANDVRGLSNQWKQWPIVQER